MRQSAISFAPRSPRPPRGGRGRIATIALLASALFASEAVALPSGEGRETDRAAEIEAAVGDLADDEVRWNAQRAMQKLREIGEPAAGALRAVLYSTDFQQRQLAAALLRNPRAAWSPLEDPSDQLMRVLVAGLRDDSLPREKHNGETVAYTYAFNGANGTAYLIRHARQAEPWLIKGLGSEDNQQRFLCAVVMGSAGRSGPVKRIAAILLPHLRDNDIPGDAKASVAALYRLGEAVEPFLRQARDGADRQQGRLIDLILLDLRSPPKTEAQLRKRRAMHGITTLYDDPATQYRFGDYNHGPMLWHPYFSGPAPRHSEHPR